LSLGEASVDMYWASSSEVKETINVALYRGGSKDVVTDAFPEGGAINGWDHVPGTSNYVHLLENKRLSASK
jgi:hypothetical protein